MRIDWAEITAGTGSVVFTNTTLIGRTRKNRKRPIKTLLPKVDEKQIRVARFLDEFER